MGLTTTVLLYTLGVFIDLSKKTSQYQSMVYFKQAFFLNAKKAKHYFFYKPSKKDDIPLTL